MIPSAETFAAHVSGHAGVSPERAAEAAHHVVARIGGYLSDGHRELIAEELPRELADDLRREADLARPIDEALLAPGTTAAQARELVASVCRVLSEELSREAVRVLRGTLPPDLASLLSPSGEPVEPPVHAPLPRERRTLATAQPGSTHPISEAHPLRGQHDSVVAANPHEDSKLSSNQPEPPGETLARGKPGSRLPLSSTKS